MQGKHQHPLETIWWWILRFLILFMPIFWSMSLRGCKRDSYSVNPSLIQLFTFIPGQSSQVSMTLTCRTINTTACGINCDDLVTGINWSVGKRYPETASDCFWKAIWSRRVLVHIHQKRSAKDKGDVEPRFHADDRQFDGPTLFPCPSVRLDPFTNGSQHAGGPEKAGLIRLFMRWVAFICYWHT